ncbi:MAG: large conductance mechanosensitive channel protein MscL [Lachnospiraceae bacterium]|nr:large conductance mechanosensitive channel protein MscL [Lachnospiraceae bacterium]
MKNFWKEFKEFISRGSVMDMAVGIIIGGAFTAIVNSLVNDIVMPILSLLTGGYDFTKLSVTFGEGEEAAVFNYGLFISAVINFLLIALVIFCIIKSINKMKDKFDRDKKEEAATTKVCPFCKSEIDIEATRCPHCTSQLDK